MKLFLDVIVLFLLNSNLGVNVDTNSNSTVFPSNKYLYNSNIEYTPSGPSFISGLNNPPDNFTGIESGNNLLAVYSRVVAGIPFIRTWNAMLFLSSWSISMYDFFSRNIDLIETGMEAS